MLWHVGGRVPLEALRESGPVQLPVASLDDLVLWRLAKRCWHALRLAVRAIVSAGASFDRHDAMTMAAALAFYTALSLAPALVLIFWISGWVTGYFNTDIPTLIHEQLEELVEPKALAAVESAVAHALSEPIARNLAGVLSIAFAVFASTAAFGQVRRSLNRIWDVEAIPGRTVINFVRTRLLSLAMLVAFGLLLVLSLAVSTATNVAIDLASDVLPMDDLLWLFGRIVPPMLVFWLLFSAMFKVLPDVRLGWGDVLLGAAITALLFSLGKALLSLYFSEVAPGSAYGAAGSLLALLLWIYYSAIILFYGAELTHTWELMRGRRFEPRKNARWVEIPKWEQEGPPKPGEE